MKVAASLLLAVGISLNGCVLVPSTDPLDGAFVHISKISPDDKTTLHPGDSVTFEVEIEYTMPAEEGRAHLAIQRTPTSGILASAKADVAKGRGTVRLSATIVVPETPVIAVYVGLSQGQRRETSTVEGRNFKVSLKS
jgi:hypothetical protein